MADNQYLQPFFDSLSQGVQVAQHLKQAAMQQQENDRQNALAQSQQALREQEFRASQQGTLADMLRNGAQPVDSSGNISTPNPSITATPGAMTADKNMNFTSPTISASLNPSGGGTAQVPSDPNQTVNMGGRQVQMPSWSDQLQRTAQAKEATADATRVPITKEGADLIGNIFPVGTMVDPAHMPGLASLARAKAAADAGQGTTGKTIAEKKLSTDDNGRETWKILYDDGTTAEVPTKSRGKTDKFSAGNAAAAAENGQTKALTENQRSESANKALKDYQTLLDQKNKIEAENRNIDIALNSGRHYIDKDGHLTAFDRGGQTIAKADRSGYQDAMRARKQANMERLPQVVSDMQGAQNRYADLSGNDGARPQGGRAPAAAAAPAAQAAPAPAAPQTKQPAAANAPAAPANDPPIHIQLPNGKYLSGPKSKVQAYLKSKGYSLTDK